MSTQPNLEQLKQRIDHKKHQLLGRLSELQSDTRKEAITARAAVQRKLDELDATLTQGWDRMTDDVKAKLDRWLTN